MEENQTDKIKEEKKENTKKKTIEELKKIQLDNIRGRVIIFDAENSEFAQKLKLKERGEYTQKQK